jgi:hypothetical protein
MTIENAAFALAEARQHQDRAAVELAKAVEHRDAVQARILAAHQQRSELAARRSSGQEHDEFALGAKLQVIAIDLESLTDDLLVKADAGVKAAQAKRRRRRIPGRPPHPQGRRRRGQGASGWPYPERHPPGRSSPGVDHPHEGDPCSPGARPSRLEAVRRADSGGPIHGIQWQREAAVTDPITTAPKRRLAYLPRFSSKNTEFRLLKQRRAATFSGDSAAAEALIRLGRDERAEKEKRKKLDGKLARARLARKAKAAAKVETKEVPAAE